MHDAAAIRRGSRHRVGPGSCGRALGLRHAERWEQRLHFPCFQGAKVRVGDRKCQRTKVGQLPVRTLGPHLREYGSPISAVHATEIVVIIIYLIQRYINDYISCNSVSTAYDPATSRRPTRPPHGPDESGMPDRFPDFENPTRTLRGTGSSCMTCWALFPFTAL
jgi:hypothetical protein